MWINWADFCISLRILALLCCCSMYSISHVLTWKCLKADEMKDKCQRMKYHYGHYSGLLNNVLVECRTWWAWEALWCPFLQLVKAVLEGVVGCCFDDLAREPIPKLIGGHKYFQHYSFSLIRMTLSTLKTWRKRTHDRHHGHPCKKVICDWPMINWPAVLLVTGDNKLK